MTNENKWQPIETAPKDKTEFLAKIGDAVYVAYYDNGTFIWVMHSNVASGRCYRKKVIDGIEYQLEIKPEEEPNYQVQGYIWKKGFEDKPTHWIPLPKLPITEKEGK
jgi:hypothetical protein